MTFETKIGEEERPDHQRRPRIAVIAVHGVADQQPFETARSIVSLLHSVDSRIDPGPPAPDTPNDGGAGAAADADDLAASVRYSEFVEASLHIPLSPLKLTRSPRAEGAAPSEKASVGDRIKRPVRKGLYSSYEARSLSGEITPGPVGRGADYEYMHNQLRNYTGEGEPASHQTIGLSGHRRSNQPRATEADIDIYELYWADLSRLGTGLLRILGEFYQLLFHLGALARTTIGIARIQNGDRGFWPALSFFQSASAWLLALPIAILNLYLVVLALGLAVVKVPNEPGEVRVYVLTLVGAAVFTVLAARRIYKQWRYGFWTWSAGQIMGFLLGAGLAWLLFAYSESAYVMLSLIWIGITVLVVWIIAERYARRREYAVEVAQACALIVVAAAIYVVRRSTDTPDEAIFVLGRTSEVIFQVLGLLWLLLVISHSATWIFGELVMGWPRRKGSLRDQRSQTERAIWTGRLGLFVPAALFLILTLSLWLLLRHAVGDELKAYDYTSGFLGIEKTTVPDFMDELIERSGGALFNAFFILIGIAFLMVAWGVLPAVLAEVSPPKDPLKETSPRLGHWLDHGFRLGRVAGRLALFATFVVLPGGFVLATYFPEILKDLPDWLKSLGEGKFFITLVTLLGGSAVGLVALGRHLSRLFLGFRAPLDVALDVDNWLRERPLDSNPRARICARYVSLLRHICRFGERENAQYDALVIVAHSQGTIVTTDLLRFLGQTQPPEPDLRRLGRELPVYLLTVGCPLRQLYGRRFPHLYEWATHGGSGTAVSSSIHYGSLPRDQQPEPRELGVELWVNAFRSGDYVGRHVWLSDDLETRWAAAAQSGNAVEYVANDSLSGTSEVSDTSRVELCIGAGAHTHYFDESGVRVAQLLDQLIGVAIAGKPNYRLPFPYFRAGT